MALVLRVRCDYRPPMRLLVPALLLIGCTPSAPLAASPPSTPTVAEAPPQDASLPSSPTTPGTKTNPCAAVLCAPPSVCVPTPDGEARCLPPDAGKGSGAGGKRPCVVGGCSGTVCADESMMSTCEFRPEHACYRAAVCERDAAGACGWRKTPELAACLKSPPR